VTKAIPPKNNPIAELLSSADPKNIAAAIERERRVKAQPGWLGVTVLARANWQMSLALGDGVRQIDAHPRSSAYRHAGLRTGDYLKPIKLNGAAGVSVEDFDSLALLCGAKVPLEFYRHGTGRAAGWLAGEATLTAPPRIPVIPDWKKLSKVPCGRRVQKKDRSKFLADMSERRGVTPSMLRVINLLALKYDNHNYEGFWPSYATMAAALGCSRRHAIKLIERLQWAGIVKVVEGPTAQRASNLYQLTWPGRSPAVSPRRTWRL
jgi:hypothetical protein